MSMRAEVFFGTRAERSAPKAWQAAALPSRFRQGSASPSLMPLLGPSLVARVLTKERDDAVVRAAAADKVVAEAQQKLELVHSMEEKRETAHTEQMIKMRTECASLIIISSDSGTALESETSRDCRGMGGPEGMEGIFATTPNSAAESGAPEHN